MSNRTIALCAGTIALACAAMQPAIAADMPYYPPQYSGPPVVQERYVQEHYVYQEPPQAYYRAAPAPVYREYAPPALVPIPEPYYVPPRRVYVDPGYGAYGYGPGPYVARGYGYHRGWGHRRW